MWDSNGEGELSAVLSDAFMKTGTLVEIVWNDHFDENSVTPEALMSEPVLAFKTCGYYIGENKHYYFIARDMATDELYRDKNNYCGYLKASSTIKEIK